MRDLKAAFSLLTILPVPGAQLAPRPASAVRFPVVGAFIGVVVAGVLVLPLPALLARRLGELSGDVHGAAAVLAETIVLYSFLPTTR
jgi:cobalamin synthase